MGLFNRDKCKKLIKYNDRGIEFTFGDENAFFPFVNIKISPKKLEESCDVAKALDDYLYRLCKKYGNLDSNSSEYKEYLKKHDRVDDLMTSFRVSLAVKDSKGEHTQEERISESIKAIQDFLTRETKPKRSPKKIMDPVNIQNKKLLKITTSIIIASVIVIGILTATMFSMQQEHAREMRDVITKYETLLREKQVNGVQSLINQEIQTLIDSSNLYTMMFTKGYEQEEDTQKFVDRITEELRFTDLFIPNVRSSDITAYVYVMEPDPECEFLSYAYLPHMERANGEKLEECYEMQDNEMYLTNMYPSTGTTSFVNALAKRIDLDPNDDKYDIIIASAIDWDRFSNNIQRSITLEDTRFVLVDAQDNVVVDCDKNSCKNIKALALADEEFSENSVARKYDPNEYDIYQNHPESLLLDNNELERYNIQNSKLLEGWKLYMHYN